MMKKDITSGFWKDKAEELSRQYSSRVIAIFTDGNSTAISGINLEDGRQLRRLGGHFTGPGWGDKYVPSELVDLRG